ncbi:MAG: TlpA family protein disulfide reductase [Myxococcales bacterium]|nr:TlpA family protein disulfide reductase [Myxococcales bacterium]
MWWLLASCSSDPGASAPVPRRVDAVAAHQQVDPPDAFCDVWSEGGAASVFPAPAVDGDPIAPATGWRWVNVWATWCAPCIAEMPKLVRWRDELSAQGAPVELVLVSVDEQAPVMDRFLKQHPDFPPSTRLADPATLPDWLTALGLGTSAAIPLHLFVDAENRLRCVRAGELDEHHLPSIRAILSGS